ncbi:MAG TPA: translocation/assembly module TamB domain-containing protein [Candidatus Binatia bacterium]|nr:translocation/assembly module TamB domain-containing protein [Candidatus Binatia bacterium]
MEKFWRVCRYLAYGIGLLLVLGVIGLVFYSHTDGFRELVRQKTLAAINDSIRGQISIARLDGSIWGRLTIVDLRLLDNGGEIIRIPQLKINYFLLPLIWGEFQVSRLEATQPRLRLSEGPDGEWNIVEALSSSAPQTETSGVVVSIGSLGVEKADIDVSSSGRSYRAAGLNIQGRAGIGPDGMSVDLQQISSRVLTEGLPEARIQGALAYQDSNGQESLKFSDFAVESGNSGLKLTGKIADLKTFETEAKVSIEKLAPADMARFVPQWPVKAIVSGTADVRGPLTDLRGDFSFFVADGSLSGNFHADVTRDSPKYEGHAKITQVNLAKLLERKELRGIVSALIKIEGGGFALANLSGQGEATVRGTDVASWNLGDVFLKASLAGREAKVTGQLKSELGRADWEGEIAFTDTPRYHLSFSANQLDVQKLSSDRTIKGNLNLTGVVKGSGLTLAEMNTSAKIDLQRSRLGEVELDQGTLVATISDQRMRVEQGSLKAADAILNVRGDIGTDLKQQGKLDYQLRVENLSPWLSLIDQEGSGSVVLVGQAQGNFTDLKAKGKITASSLSYQGTAVQRGSVQYDLGYSTGRSLPYGTLNFSLSDVGNGYRLKTITGVMKNPTDPANSIELNAKASDFQGRTHTVAGNVKVQPELVVAQLTRLSLDLPDGTWRISQPVTLTQRGPDFIVDRLAMRNNGSQLLLDGRFSLAGSQALRLSIEGLPIESVRAFFPDTPDVTGILATQLQLRGTAAAPEIEGTAKLEKSKIAGFAYDGLIASGSYRNQRADLKVTLRQDPLHQLDANASLPMILAWSNGWRAELSDNIEARIQSSGLSLAFLNALSGKTVKEIGGEVEADIQVRGSLNQPLASGFVRLRDGKLTATPLGLQISSITAEGSLEPRGIRISQLSAHANKGELNASGFIALQKFSPQAMDFSIDAKQWPAINTQRYQVELNGAAKIGGTLAAPRISGKFEVPRGELRPDLSFLDRSGTPIKRDPTIKVVSSQPSGASTAKPEEDQVADSELWRNSTVDVQVTILKNVWLRHRNADIELSGNLRVMKASGGDPRLTGMIESIRGWMVFQGRRFTLSQGRLEFTGGENIDPVLDIVAERRVNNYLVKVIVKGTSEKPTLTLASDPQLDQADILSLLLFNKPVSALDKGEQTLLQQNAIGIVGGFAATKIGQAVAESLGLQNLGVDIGSIDFSGDAVRYGQYVGGDTFISVSQEISGQYGREVSAEYQITREWKFSVSSSTTGPDGADLIWQKRY